MSIRILLVEDEDHLADTIKLNLELEDYKVVVANDGHEALRLFKEERFNLIILDVMLPKVNGVVVSERIRLENDDIPILILSARNTSEERIKGLKSGATDYLTKPFNLEELLLKVAIMIKLAQKMNGETPQVNSYIIDGKQIDFDQYMVHDSNQQFQLTKKEAMLLKLLIEKKGQVVSREEILEKVWGYDVYPSTRTIDNFILAFRKYFNDNPKQPRFFHSIRGVGYKFTDSE
jgi:two-component system alkaline phosphatase synthesis response regulator PhoP